MYQRILVPVDGSLTSDRGVEEAARLALLTRGRIKLMHVLDEITVTAELQGYAGSMGDWIGELRSSADALLERAASTVRGMGVEATTLLQDGLAGPIHEPIVTEALLWQADLIVLGTHGRHGLKRLYLGSGAESILRHAPVPVLLVRYVAEKPPATASFELPHLVPVPA